MRHFSPQETEKIVAAVGLKFIQGDSDVPGPARIAYLLMDEIERIHQRGVDDGTVGLMLTAAAQLAAYATEKMAADEARIDLLRRTANSKYLRITYIDDAGNPYPSA